MNKRSIAQRKVILKRKKDGFMFIIFVNLILVLLIGISFVNSWSPLIKVSLILLEIFSLIDLISAPDSTKEAQTKLTEAKKDR